MILLQTLVVDYMRLGGFESPEGVGWTGWPLGDWFAFSRVTLSDRGCNLTRPPCSSLAALCNHIPNVHQLILTKHVYAPAVGQHQPKVLSDTVCVNRRSLRLVILIFILR